MASVIVRKSDNMVKDASNGEINYNPVEYDNLHPATNPIPAGENPKKYYRDANGDIVKRPQNTLIADFPDERQAHIKTKWRDLKTAIPNTEPWKQALVDLATSLGWE